MQLFTVEVEEQLIGKHVLQWNVQFSCNRFNQTIKTAGNQINRFVCGS